MVFPLLDSLPSILSPASFDLSAELKPFARPPGVLDIFISVRSGPAVGAALRWSLTAWTFIATAASAKELQSLCGDSPGGARAYA